MKNSNACVRVYVFKFVRYLYSSRATRLYFQLMMPKLASSLLLQTRLWIDSISFYHVKLLVLFLLSRTRLIRFYMAPPPFLWSLKCRGITLSLARRKQIARFRQRSKGIAESGNTGSPQYPFAHREYWIPWKWCASRMQMHLAPSRVAREHIYICFEILLSCPQEERKLQFKYSLNIA